MLNVVITGLVTYLLVLVLIRITGHRQMSQKTPFDVALILLIAQAAQYAMLGIGSLTKAGVLIITLVGTDILFSLLAHRFHWFELLDEGSPVIIMADGRPLRERLDANRISVAEILEAARRDAGIARLDQVRYAVLEKTGQITVIPWEQPGAGS